MIGSLRTRLFGSMVLVTALVVVTSWVVAEPLLAGRVEREGAVALRATAIRLGEALESGGAPAEVGARLAERLGASVAIYDVEGRALWPAGAPRLAGVALEHGAVRVERDGVAEVERLVLVERRGDHLLRLSQPLPSLEASRDALRLVLLFAGLFALLMSALLAEYLTRAIGRPIREMTSTADAFRGGDLSQRVRSARSDELGALGGAIDQMADQLVERLEDVSREEGRLRTILDAMVEAVLVTDRSGKIVLTNQALGRLAGGDVVGRTTVEAIRSPELHEAVQLAGQEGRSPEVHFEIVVGGALRSIAAQVTPLPAGRGVVAVLHDVTQLKRADAVRRDFVANASHELRTPLTSIRGFAETLLDGALGDERMSRRFVQNIADNAVRLQRLVEDLLELSRAESPEAGFDLMPVDVAEVAAKVISGLENRAAEKDQALSFEAVDEAVRARADARALDQVLLNLADNAIKYTPAGGRITIRARAEGNKVVIEVEDTGPGIPRAQQARIFERFYRVDKGRARAQGGTGLGLSIVRHLVQRMEGDIALESKVGQGSTFRVTLARAG